MNSETNTTYFQKQIAFAHVLQQHTNQILEIKNPGHQLAVTNLQLLAERIFKYLSDNQSTLDLKELKAVSSLILRHISAYNRIKSFELKILKFFKENFLELNLQDLQLATVSVGSTPGAAPETTTDKNITPSDRSLIDVPRPDGTAPESILPSTYSNIASQNANLVKRSNCPPENIVLRNDSSVFSYSYHSPMEAKDLIEKIKGTSVENTKPFSAKELSFLLNSNGSNHYQSQSSFAKKTLE